MEGAAIAALGTAAAAVIVALGSAAVYFYRTRAGEGRKTEKTAVGQWREVADAQQKQIGRQDGHIREMTEALEELIGEHTDCQVDLAALYGELRRIHDHAVRVTRCCRELGRDPGEPPEMPPRPPRPDREASEFKKRTLAQKTQNLQQLSGVIPPIPSTPPPGEKQP